MRAPVDVATLEARLRGAIATGNVVSFVAERDGTIVGDASLIIRDDRTMLGMCIAPPERGRRLGGALLDAALAAATALERPVVSLDVYAHNEAARRLYATRGFVVVGEPDEDDRGNGIVFTVIAMERRAG